MKIEDRDEGAEVIVALSIDEAQALLCAARCSDRADWHQMLEDELQAAADCIRGALAELGVEEREDAD